MIPLTLNLCSDLDLRSILKRKPCDIQSQKLWVVDDLLLHRLHFIHVPICIHKPPTQELSFGTGKPQAESSR